MNVHRLRLPAAAGIAAATLAWCLGCSRPAAPPAQDQLLLDTSASPVSEKPLYEVKRGTVTREIQFLGTVAPHDERHLYFRVDGRCQSVRVKPGDWVKQGDLLAELEMTDLLDRIAQAGISLEKARARVAEEQTGSSSVADAESRLTIARLRLQEASSQDPAPGVAIARAALDRAALAVEAGKLNDRVRGVDQPSPVLQETILDQRIAEASYELALQRAKSHDYQVRILQEEVTLAQSALTRAKEYRDPQASSDLKLAELTLTQLESQKDLRRVVSPIRGQVMFVRPSPGSEEKAFSPVIIVADPSALEVKAELAGTDVLALHIGQETAMELANQPSAKIRGRVAFLPYSGVTSAERQGGADTSTRIAFTAPPSLVLKTGDLLRGSFVLERRDGVLYLPPEAIRSYQGRRFVVIQEGDRNRSVDVRLGTAGSERVEILEGLAEGQRVIGQ
jgi:multidrug efflux pump subunit AcrA (membrane-fusion protein)